MNKPNINKKRWRGSVGLWAITALAGALLVATGGVASADYGQGAQYQIELVAQTQGGGGAWLWIALYPDGTGDYAGSDCAGGVNRFLHGQETSPPPAPDAGDATWHYVGSYIDPCTGVTYSPAIEIDGVILAGFPGGFPTTITVPATYAHYSTNSFGSFMTWPFPPCEVPSTFSNVQVAP
jgi:hypothetical protein